MASYLFLVLGTLSPFATFWVVKRESDLYCAQFGVRPEGMGIFGMVLMGAAVTFILLTLSAFMAFFSYLALEVPRASLRKLELGFICLLPLLVVAFVYFGMMGGPFDSPQVIQTH